MRISRRKFRPKKIEPVYYVNETIRVPQLRLIDDEGEHIGIMSTGDALAKARERELDLVVIQTKTDPPIARIVDFGKYKYEQDKEEQKNKAKQKSVEVKGIRLSVRIGAHDMEVRKEQAKKFFGEGNKIKVEIILRGREKAHSNIAEQTIREFTELLHKDVPVKIETPLTRQGGQLTVILGKA